MMVQFQHDYPGVMKQENVEDILNNLQKRENSRAAVLEQLKKQMIDTYKIVREILFLSDSCRYPRGRA